MLQQLSLERSGDVERADSLMRAIAASPLRSPPARTFRRGETIAGRYRIECRLGAGGMGVVYAARDLQLGRSVALKVVKRGIDSDDAQRRLVREARAMAMLRDANVATIYDLGRVDERSFIVMELVGGGTLAGWLHAERRPWKDVLRKFLHAAHGLAAAHAVGLVHGDFKPQNVLVDKDDGVRIADFGVARLLGDRPLPEEAASCEVSIAGTPGFMAPELVRGLAGDARADQFSFCVALYEALYGERPDAAPSGAPLLPARGLVPRWLHEIIVRGLAADPKDRWPSMESLSAAIERRLEGTSEARLRQLALRRVLFALVALAVAAAALAGCAGPLA